MLIYFAASIRAGRGMSGSYAQLISYIKEKHGSVLTEHVSDGNAIPLEDVNLSPREIFERDRAYLGKADAVVAEVSVPSLGVGWELREAEQLKKPILCLYVPEQGKRLSAMLLGNDNIKVKEYNSIDGAKGLIDEFINSISGRSK